MSAAAIPEAIEITDIESLINAEKKAILALEELKKHILEVHKDCSIAITVGAGTSIAGSISTVAGFLLAPVTAGASLALTVGGIAAIAAGTGTAVGTRITKMVKRNGWIDELLKALADRELQLQKIGDKIVSHPDWIKVVELAGKQGADLVISQLPNCVKIARITKYLSITGPKYGIDKGSSLAFGAPGLPTKLLLKTNDLLVTNLAKMGIRAARVGLQGLMLLRVGIGVLGIGLDVYNIVDTWVNDPDVVKDIDNILKELKESIPKLEKFLIFY